MVKKISFLNDKRQNIVGLLNIPNGRGPFPAVIICHGLKGYKEQAHLKSLASALASQGLAALRFDFTNEVGKSFGQLENVKFSQELKDLKAAIDYLTRQKFVDAGRIGLVGHSLGSQLVFHYAPTDRRVKVLAGLAGSYIRGKGLTNLEKQAQAYLPPASRKNYFYIYSKRTKKRYKIKIDFYYDLLKHDTSARIKKIKIPALLVHGTKDYNVALLNSRKVYRMLKGPKKLAIILGAPHTWRGKADPGGKFQKKINPLVVNWFKEYL